MTQKCKEELDQLLRIGQYRDYSEVVAVAISNQLLLHGKVSSAVVVSERVTKLNPAPHATRASASEIKPECSRVPMTFSLPGSIPEGCEPAPLPNDVFVPGQQVPIDRWIFGQHNKLLPAKASCRALATLSVNGKGVPLTRAASEIASQAVFLGDYLRDLDAKNGSGRDEALAVAFPYSGSETGDKARLRYGNQFVASINKQGQLAGLLVDLKLINRVPGKEPRLLLTEPGWQFARLANPILDGGNTNGTSSKLSEQEVEFLLDHIASRVPAENFAYQTVTRGLLEGANVPDKLDDFLEQYLPRREEKPFTRAFLTTQRSGVISRMTDLGLVQKVRDGVKVTYVPTDRATQYLKKSQAVKGGQ